MKIRAPACITVYRILEEIRIEKSTTVKYINVQCLLRPSTLYNAQPLPNLFDTGSFFDLLLDYWLSRASQATLQSVLCITYPQKA
jgi:hypothetical protein